MSDVALPAIAHDDRLVVVVGASGVGKDSVMRAWRAIADAGAFHVARRVITRAPDASEDHEPVTDADFDALRARGLLATWWRAHGLAYGVRASELAGLARGGWVVVNGSRAHLPALRAQAPRLRTIEITAPADVLAARLAARAREDAQAREGRLQRRVEGAVDADLTLVNDGELRRCVDELQRWWRAVSRAA